MESTAVDLSAEELLAGGCSAALSASGTAAEGCSRPGGGSMTSAGAGAEDDEGSDAAGSDVLVAGFLGAAPFVSAGGSLAGLYLQPLSLVCALSVLVPKRQCSQEGPSRVAVLSARFVYKNH